MPQATDKKRSRRHALLYLLCAVVVLLGIFMGCMAIRENHRHAELLADVSSLQISLQRQGIDTKKTSGCARLEMEFGPGDKHCNVELQFYTTSDAGLRRTVHAYQLALSDSKHFVARNPLKSEIGEAKYGEGSYMDASTQKMCGILYQYIKSTSQYNVQFSCDDTSWFVKTFENGIL